MAAAVPLSAALQVGMRVVALRPGEPSGDAARHFELPAAGGTGDGHLLAIVDGLGHGAPAAVAADAALRAIGERPALPLPALFGALDTALADTRGAAIGLGRIDGLRMRYAGLGNTRALRWRGPHWLRLSSQYGIVGGGMPPAIQVTEIDLQPGDWLLLYTDGVDEMVQLPLSLPEWEREPQRLCDHLLAHWRHARDDAAVLACHLPRLAPVEPCR